MSKHNMRAPLFGALFFPLAFFVEPFTKLVAFALFCVGMYIIVSKLIEILYEKDN